MTHRGSGGEVTGKTRTLTPNKGLLNSRWVSRVFFFFFCPRSYGFIPNIKLNCKNDRLLVFFADIFIFFLKNQLTTALVHIIPSPSGFSTNTIKSWEMWFVKHTPHWLILNPRPFCQLVATTAETSLGLATILVICLTILLYLKWPDAAPDLSERGTSFTRVRASSLWPLDEASAAAILKVPWACRLH